MLVASLTIASRIQLFNADCRFTALMGHRMAELVTFKLSAGIAGEVFSAALAGIKVGGTGFAVQRICVAHDVCNWICAGRSFANAGAVRLRAGV